jgi:hypothetical protein
MSTTVCVAPIMAALAGTGDILGEGRLWRPQNRSQERILELLKMRSSLDSFFDKEAEGEVGHRELRYWVDWVAERLNRILREEGFSIQLEDFKEGEFGVVSILDVLVEWFVQGGEDKIFVGDVAYPAVRMNSEGMVDGQHMSLVEVMQSFNHPEPIGMMHTKSGDRVYMAKSRASSSSPRGFDLYTRVGGIQDGISTRIGGWAGMIFPMVDINDQPDISWLKGLWTTTDDHAKAEISQAFQQTKFKMNQFGARVKSAVAISAMLMTAMPPEDPPWLVIDEPFYLWIERPGVPFPVVAMHVDYSDWKDPGDLANM